MIFKLSKVRYHLKTCSRLKIAIKYRFVTCTGVLIKKQLTSNSCNNKKNYVLFCNVYWRSYVKKKKKATTEQQAVDVALQRALV